MSRRDWLTWGGAAFAAQSVVLRDAIAATPPLAELRLGYQKSGALPSVKKQGLFEKAFKPLGVEIKWFEFASGPPLLEALSAGAIVYGPTGDTPPIFAQAARANLLYVAALQGSGENEAIIVPEASPIRTLADLKGKRVGLTKGSASQNTIVAALEKVGLRYADITPVFVSQVDGAGAFQRGSLDAWIAWDPILATVQSRSHVRVLAWSKDVHKTNAFLLGNRDFVAKYPDIVHKLNAELTAANEWAQTHVDEVARDIVEATGADNESILASIRRSRFQLSPLTEEIIATQQTIADRFATLGLIPAPVRIKDVVWDGALPKK
ncbi:MAG: sulfonate ABC transporter substrate-binding protein [Methylocystaceae bacterium]|nr:MAG: sulfonate ABC transporter substrate-binding protein [Methylocystaceae bacterium]